jgi:hypothetical protein
MATLIPGLSIVGGAGDGAAGVTREVGDGEEVQVRRWGGRCGS